MTKTWREQMTPNTTLGDQLVLMQTEIDNLRTELEYTSAVLQQEASAVDEDGQTINALRAELALSASTLESRDRNIETLADENRRLIAVLENANEHAFQACEAHVVATARAMKAEAELAVQTQAADHWMSEACRDHNALEKLRTQEPDIYVHKDGEEVWGANANPALGSDPSFTAYYLAAGAQKEQA